jgi:hypothetical protein
VVSWYDHRFKESAAPAHDSAVEYFVLNLNGWRTATSWPPDGAEPMPLFLDSGGHANSCRGDGTLSRESADSGNMDRFEYDPRNPVMSLEDWRAKAAGLDDSLSMAVDQTPLRDRRDILVYVGEVLEKDFLVVGDPEVILWAASTAPDTDFTAKLIEVKPDGAAIMLSQGIIRARYRRGYDREVFLDHDEPEEFVIRLGPIAILMQTGSQIRVDITSSDFPNFDRNHNTDKPFWSDSELRIARQTVLHDRERPSRVVLPVLES